MGLDENDDERESNAPTTSKMVNGGDDVRPLANGYGIKSLLQSGPVLISRDVAELIETFDGATLAEKLKNLVDERDEMVRRMFADDRRN